MKFVQYPINNKAGNVKITPAAKDSPAEADVCVRLCSNIVEFLKNLKMLIDMMAAGIDAETVIPANNPRYVFAPDRSIEKKIPRIIDLNVNSLFLFDLKFYKDY